MKTFTRKFTITSSNDTSIQSIKVTNFSQIYALQAGAYDHDTVDEKAIASVSVSNSLISDSPVIFDVDHYAQGVKTKKQPLFFYKPVRQNENINIQVHDKGKAATYPYRVIVTVFVK